MESYLNQLLENSSEQLNSNSPDLGDNCLPNAGLLETELLKMLTIKNGFYALENALHVFPSHSSGLERGLAEWNNKEGWKKDYGSMVDGCFFFAEDIFGGQFCIQNNQIHTFEPETGEVDYLASSFEDWSKKIINDYNVLTGYSLASQWQNKYGALQPGFRLLPKIPFVAGGGFEVENLTPINAIEGMKYRADIAQQIKNLPDGSEISINFSE